MKQWINSNKYFLLLFSLGFFLIFWQLGAPALWEGDEGIYGGMAHEMLKTGDVITPHFNGVPRFDKPPLYFWLTAILYTVAGVHEWTVRFWPAFFGLATVLLTFFIGTRWWNRRTGFLAGLILLTSLQWVVQSRVAVMDTMLTFWLLLAVFGLLEWGKDRDWRYFYLAMAAMGFATLTKGPVGVLFPVGTWGMTWVASAGWRMVDKKRMADSGWRIVGGVGIFLLVSLPWYLLAFFQNGHVFLDDFFGYQNIARYTRAIEQHGAPWHYYIWMLLAGFFPWTMFLVMPVGRMVRRIKNSSSTGILPVHAGESTGKMPVLLRGEFRSVFLGMWVVFIFVFFSFSQSKLPGYILPIFPILALGIARCLEKRIAECGWRIGENISERLLFNIAFGLTLVFIALFAGALFVAIRVVNPSETPITPGLLIPLAVILGAGVVGVGLSRWKGFRYSVVILVGMSALLIGALVQGILPALESDKTVVAISRHFVEIAPPDSRIAAYHGLDPRQVFYSQRHVEELPTPEALRAYLQQPHSYVLLPRSDYLEQVQGGLNARLVDMKKNLVLVMGQ